MRVLANVSRAHFSGGVELSVYHTVKELVARGHELHLLYGEGGDLVPEYRRICRSVEHIQPWDFYFPESRKREMRERVRLLPAAARAARWRPDVYYVQRTLAAYWALDAARVARAPTVCHWRGGWTPPARYLPRLKRRVSRFLANSEWTRSKWLEVGFDPDRAEVVYPGMDQADYPLGGEAELAAAREALGVPQGAFVATFVGRLDPVKGVEVLLDAWARLGLGPDEGTLLVVGEPVVHEAPAAYLAHLRSLAPAGSVRFLGARRDVVTPLHAADVAVVPTVGDEAFGRAVVEGLLTGRPVVGARSGGIPEILSGPFERYLCEPGDAQALTGQLRSVTSWRRDDPGLGMRCARHVEGRFTVQAMADGVERNLRVAVGN